MFINKILRSKMLRLVACCNYMPKSIINHISVSAINILYIFYNKLQQVTTYNKTGIQKELKQNQSIFVARKYSSSCNKWQQIKEGNNQ